MMFRMYPGWDSFWKCLSLLLTTALIVVVASWAGAQQKRSGSSKNSDSGEEERKYAETATESLQVEFIQNKQRYMIVSTVIRGTENDKIMLYDSWDAMNTKDVWVMKDPHTIKAKWVRMEFEDR